MALAGKLLPLVENALMYNTVTPPTPGGQKLIFFLLTCENHQILAQNSCPQISKNHFFSCLCFFDLPPRSHPLSFFSCPLLLRVKNHSSLQHYSGGRKWCENVPLFWPLCCIFTPIFRMQDPVAITWDQKSIKGPFKNMYSFMNSFGQGALSRLWNKHEKSTCPTWPWTCSANIFSV